MSKIALVTGANRGIGLEVVRQFCLAGITTILTSRDEAKGRQAVQWLNFPPNILHFIHLDVDSPDSVAASVEKVRQQFGHLDILINNAGINYDTWQRASAVDMQEVEQTIQTNLLGPWRLINAFLPLMKENQYGRIVNVSSGSGAFASQNGSTPAYSLSKYALNGLTVALANDLGNNPIKVNSVCPGWVRTDMGGPGATRSTEKGAETIVWLAQLGPEGPSGKFFRDKKVIPF
jgi:NAD(P)-dependent dehydrogenase (short-subunit alcohol dehydrogenase family)